MRVAIMQPYFMPYAGYFRLLVSADLFVIYDCVQFPRRGWVHRNRLHDANGNLQWLTLPLKKGHRDNTRICDLMFVEDAQARWNEEVRRFPSLQKLRSWPGQFARSVFEIHGTPVDYITSGLLLAAGLLGIRTPAIRSSTLEVSPGIKGQDRIIEIANRVGATTYINAPGGRDLYDEEEFARAGLKLRFLQDHQGPFTSVLERLVLESPEALAKEIDANLQFQEALT